MTREEAYMTCAEYRYAVDLISQKRGWPKEWVISSPAATKGLPFVEEMQESKNKITAMLSAGGYTPEDLEELISDLRKSTAKLVGAFDLQELSPLHATETGTSV